MKTENYKKKSHKERSVLLHCDYVICVSTTPGKYGYPVNIGWINNSNCHLKDKYCMVAILCGTKKKKKANSQNIVELQLPGSRRQANRKKLIKGYKLSVLR